MKVEAGYSRASTFFIYSALHYFHIKGARGRQVKAPLRYGNSDIIFSEKFIDNIPNLTFSSCSLHQAFQVGC